MSKLKRRRITKAQVLTENEHVEMMKEKDRKEKEAEELKKKRKEEREEKRRGKERQKQEREEERQRKKKEREEEKEKKRREKERMIKEKKKQGRPKKGKQPVQAATVNWNVQVNRKEFGSSLLDFGPTPAQRVRLTVASSVQCQRTPKRECCGLFFGWTAETVVTGFIPPVHLVTIADSRSRQYFCTNCV